MDRKKIKLLKFLAIVCVIVLILELSYIVYVAFFRESKSVYFDGVNSLLNIDDGYVTVGSNNNNDKFYEKAKITKYNKKEEKTMEVLFNKGYNSTFLNVTSDDSDYIAVGNYEGTKKQHNNKVRSALLVKYDDDGSLLYNKVLDILDNSKFTDIIVVEDGYIVCGQSIYSEDNIGTSDDGGAILAKYSKDGKLMWTKNYGDNKSAVFNSITEYDGNIYVSGMNSNNVGTIVKYNLDGDKLDEYEYKFTDSLGFTDLVELNGNLYACGSKSNDDNSAMNGLIVQVDSELDYINEVVYSTNNNDRFNKIIVDNNSNIVVIGSKIIEDKSYINHDGIIAKYDDNLRKIEVVYYGDERDDYFTDVKLIDNKLIVIGYSSYEDGSYLSKFINYSSALKVLEVV